MSRFNSAFKPAADVKVMINIGGCFDIPTGRYVTGRYGESILNGGLAYLTGVIGPGNMFKSTIMRWQILRALSRMFGSEGGTYDTEISVHKERVQDMADNIPEFEGEQIFETGRWTITDKTVYSGNKWFDLEKDQLKAKIENAKTWGITTPFMNHGRTENFKMLCPTFRDVDSFSDFVDDSVGKMQDEHEVGNSKMNTVFMRQGIAKKQLLMEVPALCGASNHYMSFAAHLGTKFNMDPYAPVRKQLQHIPADYKIKDVPEKFTFQMNNNWLCFNAAVLKNDKTKAPEYPRNPQDDLEGDTDLNIVWVIQTRGKSGPTGMPIGVVVSQNEGVQPELTEFHYIKSSERFGIVGSSSEKDMTNYSLALCPDVKLSRTVVRRKFKTDAKLRRALLSTSEMCQMYDQWHHLTDEFRPNPKDLYANLKAKGYDWDVLLDTRAWWAHENDERDLQPFLSTMDLIRMNLPDDHPQAYHPYWMAPKVDGKVVSNERIPKAQWKEFMVHAKK